MIILTVKSMIMARKDRKLLINMRMITGMSMDMSTNTNTSRDRNAMGIMAMGIHISTRNSIPKHQKRI